MVGWIIAISLLVGILIFLLLAVLLWKVSGVIVGPYGAPTQGCPALHLTGGGALGRSVRLGLPPQCRYSGGRAGSPAGASGILAPLEAFHSQGWTFRGTANVSAPVCSYLSCRSYQGLTPQQKPGEEQRGLGWLTIYFRKQTYASK